MKVTILRGIPGSGKSRMACELASEVVICTDDEFMQGDKYVFDPVYLPTAHATTFMNYLNVLRHGHVLSYVGSDDFEMPAHVVVANTNISVAEISPYYQAAQAYGYPVEIITLLCDPEVAWKRNLHGLNFSKIVQMDLDLRSTKFPVYWKHSFVVAG